MTANATHPSIRFLIGLLLWGLTPIPLLAQFGNEAATSDTTPTLGKAVTEHWRVGLKITAKNGPCSGLYATLPIPQEWPEQKVRVINEDFSPQVKNVKYLELGGGMRQMQLNIPTLPTGTQAHAIVTMEIDRRPTLAPESTDQYMIPKSVPRNLRIYLAPSPGIESRHREIRDVAKQLTDGELTAWEQVEKVYDWVRDNVKYENGKLKGALAALRDKTGDCEELTSLFIAICRAMDIPARTVWVPGHCYPEFYLVNQDGDGTWFPCQAAGSRAFGSMTEARPILQKGDNFKVPHKKQRQRYVAEFLKGSATRGGGKPVMEIVREAYRP